MHLPPRLALAALPLLAGGCTIVDPREQLVVDVGTPVLSEVDFSASGSPTLSSDADADLELLEVGVGLLGLGKLDPRGQERRLWRFEGRFAGGRVAAADLFELALGGRVYHPEVAHLVPYLTGALVISWYDEQNEVNSDAQAGLRLGTGFEVDLTHSLFLYTGVDYTFAFESSQSLTTDFEVIETEYEGWALRAGLGWRF